MLSSAFIFGALAAFILGMSKSGIKGITIIIVTILAVIHGGKSSTGVLLPLLIIADIMAVFYYRREVQWTYIYKLLPWVLSGVIIGAFVGKDIPEFIFKQIMAYVILGTVGLMFYYDYRKIDKVPEHWAFAGSMGLMAGITTMIGNLAGAFTNIYFLAMRLPKNTFIGTAAYLFFIVNIFKLPFHLFLWKTINKESIWHSMTSTPFTILGFIVGLQIVRKIKDQWYRKLILILTFLGALILLFR